MVAQFMDEVDSVPHDHTRVVAKFPVGAPSVEESEACEVAIEVSNILPATPGEMSSEGRLVLTPGDGLRLEVGRQAAVLVEDRQENRVGPDLYGHEPNGRSFLSVPSIPVSEIRDSARHEGANQDAHQSD